MKSGFVTLMAILTGWVVALWVHHLTGSWLPGHTDPFALAAWVITTLGLCYLAL